MNIIKSRLQSIFGSIPDGATSFHTWKRVAVFCIGQNASFVDVEMTDSQLKQAQDAGLLGTFGWSLS